MDDYLIDENEFNEILSQGKINDFIIFYKKIGDKHCLMIRPKDNNIFNWDKTGRILIATNNEKTYCISLNILMKKIKNSNNELKISIGKNI